MHPNNESMTKVITLIKEKLFNISNGESIDDLLAKKINVSNHRRIVRSRNVRTDDYGYLNRMENL